MTGARSHRKGKSYERLIANAFSGALHHKFERVLSETRDGNSGDVRCVDDRIPLVLQCKDRKAQRPDVAWAEADAVAGPLGMYGVAVLHYGRKPGAPHRPVDLCVIELDDLLELLALIRAGGMWP